MSDLYDQGEPQPSPGELFYLAGLCREALDQWVALIELVANGQELIRRDGDIYETTTMLQILTDEIYEDLPVDVVLATIGP